MLVGGLSARVREGRRGKGEKVGTHSHTHICTHIPIQTQVIPLEEEDVELT